MPSLQAGQLHWLRSPDNGDRLPVLVLDVLDSTDSGEGHGAVLADVAPLWVDEENATDADLLLTEADSTTRRRWRVAFRHQTLVPQQALDSTLGRLTDQGLALVAGFQAGQFLPERSGPPLESEFDTRLDADGWIASILAAASANVYTDDSSDGKTSKERAGRGKAPEKNAAQGRADAARSRSTTGAPRQENSGARSSGPAGVSKPAEAAKGRQSGVGRKSGEQHRR
jgi:hypothetical protein